MTPGDRAPIVLGYDGSPGAEGAIDAAAELFPGRAAIVVHALESLSTAVFAEEAEASSPSAARLLHVPGLRAAERLVAKGCEHARRAGLEATPLVEVTPGRAADRILAVADEHDAAAVVVGARGVSQLRSLLLGSVSRAIVDGSRRPVLVVPGPRP